MLRRLIPVLSLFVLAATALTFVTSEASADQARRQARRSARRGNTQQQAQPAVYGQQQQGQPQVGMAEEQEMGATTQQQRQLGYRSYYRQPTVDAPAGAVLLNVQVPANAKVWIDGAETTQTGSSRQYVSPPLASGRQFTYVVKSRWTEDGREVVRTRRIPVEAGQAVVINMTQPTQEEARQNNNNNRKNEEERND